MKTALLYALLVGLPILGLLGVLQVGGLVDAPPAVGGWWAYTSVSAGSVSAESASAESASAESVSAECLPPTGVLEIVQSGEYTVVSVPGRPGVAARLRRGVLQTEPPATAGCAGPVALKARVGQDVAERIEGTLSGASFVAVRTEAPEAAGAAAPASAH